MNTQLSLITPGETSTSPMSRVGRTMVAMDGMAAPTGSIAATEMNRPLPAGNMHFCGSVR